MWRRFPAAVLGLLAFSVQCHGGTTVHLDLPSSALGVFGAEHSIDFATPVADIRNGLITEVRFHLEFDTTVPPNPFQDAADLAIDFQPPAGELPIYTLTGAMLGWSGAGQFTADFQTDELNLPILDFPPKAELALWFVRIHSLNGANPLLGGRLTNSFIEIDVQTIPSPGALAMLAAAGLAHRPRRRR